MAAVLVLALSNRNASCSTAIVAGAERLWHEWPFPVLCYCPNNSVMEKRSAEQASFNISPASIPVVTSSKALLELTRDALAKEWGLDHSCQVFFIVDNKLAEQPIEAPTATIPYRVHVISVRDSGREAVVADLSPSSLLTLCDRNGGWFAQANVIELLNATNALLQRFKNVFQSPITVTLGYLWSRARLIPPVHLIHRSSFFNDPAADYLWTTWPILGFLNASQSEKMAVLSRHAIVPLELDRPLFTLLIHALHHQKKMAVIQIDENRFGCICAAVADMTNEPDYLEVILIPPSSSATWRQALFQHSRGRAVPNEVGAQSHKSYAKDETFAWMTKETIQTSLTRIAKFCEGLPDKKKQLVEEANRLRNMSLVYNCPSVVEDILYEKLISLKNSANVCAENAVVISMIMTHIESRAYVLSPFVLKKTSVLTLPVAAVQEEPKKFAVRDLLN